MKKSALSMLMMTLIVMAASQNCPLGCASCSNSTGIMVCDTCNSMYYLTNQSCSLCLNGQYTLQGNSDSSCLQCSTGCSDCVSDLFCTACLQYYGFSNNSCSLCPVGQTSEGGNSTCMFCPGGCSNCSAFGTNPCSGCLLNYFLVDNSCIACPPGQYSEGGTSQCQSCPQGCSNCSISNSTNSTNTSNPICTECSINFGYSNGFCLQCSIGYYGPGNLSPCLACPIGCSNCSASNVTNSTIPTCSECQINYAYENGVCTACEQGQVSPGGTDQCQTCPNNCTSCNGAICLSCYSNYFLDNGACSACPNSTYSIGGNSSFCIPCTFNCSICNSSSCIVCETNFTLNFNSSLCILCNIQFCTYCSSTNVCQTCSGNYSVSTDNLTNQTTCVCSSSFIILNNSCVCPLGTILSQGSCVCPTPNCTNCTTNGICVLCADTYVLSGGECVLQCPVNNCITCNLQRVCTQCISGLVPSTDGLSCVTCTVDNCVSCQTNNNCTVCDSGFTLIALQGIRSNCVTCNVSNCLACLTNNVCQNCANGYTFNGAACPICPFPCLVCNVSNVCTVCLPPYSQNPLPNGTCFLCTAPNCLACSTINPNICQTCFSQYTYINSTNTCKLNCPQKCQICNSTACTICSTYYYLNINNTCSPCTNAPQCTLCDQANPNQCISCAQGLFLKNKTCFPCASYCLQCTSEQFCTALIDSYNSGFVLVPFNSTETILGSCDPGCNQCMNTNPMFCLICDGGFYISQTPGLCLPCALPSNCYQCSTSNPSFCLACYPGNTLSINNTCVLCSTNCLTCSPSNSSQCTSCASGFALNNGTCVNSLNICGIYCSSCAVEVNGVSICSLCLSGSVLNNGYCVPCQVGCSFCSNSNFTVCLECLENYYANSTEGCSPCSLNCIFCSSLGCSDCQQGYQLTDNFTCVQLCQSPCSTCVVGSPTVCLSCINGYVYSPSSQQKCQPNITCNSLQNCEYCPFGYTLASSNTNTTVNQTCVACGANCARCLSSNINSCTSCGAGTFLTLDNSCLSCPLGCLVCTSEVICLSCQNNYFALFGLIGPSGATQGPLNCIACLSPCASCSSYYSCITCVNNYTLQGTQCISNFNFQVLCVLNANSTTFSQNYLAFLTQIASSVNTTIFSITVLSISYGSVNVTMLINSPYSSGSSQAISQQNSLQNTFSQNVGGMPVVSAAITTNGGSNGIPDDDGSKSGLSHQTIIILATVIPIGTILIVIAIVIIYRRKKRGQEQETGRISDIQLSSHKGLLL